MALDHTAYCSEEELKEWMQASAADFESRAILSIESACREIDRWCGRRFYQDPAPVTRSFRVFPGQQILFIGDWAEIDDVQIGGVSQDPTSYLALPLDGVADGLDGWPITHLEGYWSDLVTIVGTPGWAAVPAPVKVSSLMVAAETFKAQEIPFGIAGMDGMGATVRVRSNPLVAAKLAPFRIPVIA